MRDPITRARSGQLSAKHLLTNRNQTLSYGLSKQRNEGTNEMNASDKIAADMIAIYFAGVAKTQKELRQAIVALQNTTLFEDALNVEAIARHNESTQGVKMF
ncbi:hypothetical protein HUU40_00105 [candidate division KSB1 bacterium]|nr:hypothetical protein [candidate division KSB1 bacterium]